MATGQLIFQPPKFDWHVEDQQLAFEEWKGQVILVLKAFIIHRERWNATIVGFLGKEGFKWWNNLPISKQEENKKNPWWSLQGYRWHPRSVYLILEPHQWDVQQHQTRRTWVYWPVRSTYQRSGRKMPVPNWSWENWYIGQSCFFMQQNILKSKSGSDWKRRERM